MPGVELQALKHRGGGSGQHGGSGRTFQEGGKLYMEKIQNAESSSHRMAAQDLTILPTDAFYPIHWAVVKKYFTLEDMQDQYRVWNRIAKNTYLFHYWNKVTKDLVPEPGSLMYKVLNNYCLLCNESATDDGLPLKPIAVEGSDLETFAEEGAGKETPEQPEE